MSRLAAIRWTSRRTTLILIGLMCLVLFGGGMAAAWNNRNHTICSDRKPPVAQLSDMLGQVDYRCHNGQIVTLND